MSSIHVVAIKVVLSAAKHDLMEDYVRYMSYDSDKLLSLFKACFELFK